MSAGDYHPSPGGASERESGAIASVEDKVCSLLCFRFLNFVPQKMSLCKG